MNFTFIHAADLHLDAALPPPAGLLASSDPDVRPGRKGGSGTSVSGVRSLAGLLREAPFLALHRLVDLCIESGAAFLLLSGDVFDGSAGSLKARLELRDAVNRLGERGIHVFWARGNHDPLPSGRPGSPRESWPENLHIFDSDGQCFALPWSGFALGEPVLLGGYSGREDGPDAGSAANVTGSPVGHEPWGAGLVPGSHQHGSVLPGSKSQPAQASLFGAGHLPCPGLEDDSGLSTEPGSQCEQSAPGGSNFTGPSVEADFSRGAALIHGISHDGPSVRENLATRLAEKSASLLAGIKNSSPASRLFQAGVLHCAVGGRAGAHENYAPCLLSDLQQSGFDYWALGHIHLPGVLCEQPQAVYPGSLQGLHVRESGPRGCRLCRVSNGKLEGSSFIPLAPVRWELLEINLTSIAGKSLNDSDGSAASLAASLLSDVSELDDFLLERVRAALAAVISENDGSKRAPGSGQPAGEACAPLAVLFRLRLSGRTALDGELRREGSLTTLQERLNQGLPGSSASSGNIPLAHVRDIKLETRPELDFAGLMAGDNLVAESLRGAVKLGVAAARLGRVEESPEDSGSLGSALARDMTCLADAATSTGAPGGLTCPECAPGADESELLDFYRQPLEQLYKHPALRQAGAALLPPPGTDELAEVAAEAAMLCLELFEVER